MTKIERYLLPMMFLLVIIAIISVLVMMLFPWKAIDVYNQPYELEKTVIVQGSWITYPVEYCRYTNVDSHVIHELETKDGKFARIYGNTKIEEGEYTQTPTNPGSDGIRLTEGCGKIKKSVYIPKFIEPGEYRLKESVTYPINPFHTTDPYIFVTEWFKVVEYEHEH